MGRKWGNNHRRFQGTRYWASREALKRFPQPNLRCAWSLHVSPRWQMRPGNGFSLAWAPPVVNSSLNLTPGHERNPQRSPDRARIANHSNHRTRRVTRAKNGAVSRSTDTLLKPISVACGDSERAQHASAKRIDAEASNQRALILPVRTCATLSACATPPRTRSYGAPPPNAYAASAA
jgi:hypothetical protein